MDSKAHDILTSLPLFQGVGALDVVRILDNVNCELQRLDAGQRWQQQGDVCQQLVCLVSGSMRVTTAYADGKYKFTELMESPKVIEPDILFGIQRQYTASYTAECSCQLLTIPKNDISRMLFSIEVFRLNFLNLLSTCSVRHREASLPQPVSNTTTRFVQFIQAHTSSPTGWKQMNIRQEDLCLYLGISRMVVSGLLHNLENKGLIRLSRNTIEVPDMERLAQNSNT